MRWIPVLTLLSFGLVVPTAGADDPAATYMLPEYIREAPVLPDALQDGPPLALLLQDAVLLAIEGNLGIHLEREQRATQAGALLASHSTFEPRLSLAYDHSNSRTPPLSSFDGASDALFPTSTDRVVVGFAQALPTATEIGLDFTTLRTSSALGTAVEPLVVRDYLGISLRQPLLKGFGFDLRVSRARLLRATMSSKDAALQVRIVMADAVQATEDLYWDLVLALKTWQVEAGALQLAQNQLALTQRQIDGGVLPPSDLIQAEASLAQRELSMVRATAAIETARDRLQVVIGPGQDTWQRSILPLEVPTFAAMAPDLEAAFALADTSRPELAQARTGIALAAVNLAVATNELLPELSVDLGLGVVGQDTSGGAALRKLGTFEARAWSAGVAMSWSPALRAGVGGLRQAQAGKRTAATQLVQGEVAVQIEVRAAHRDLLTAGRQVVAAAKFRGLSERSLEVEQRRFLDGISSNFLVAQRQDDLAQARLAELAALVAHRKARTGWELATGQLLTARGIAID